MTVQQKVLDFLNKERVCALAIMLGDGSLHNCAMHYSFVETPLTFYFSTDKTSRKCAGWEDRETTKASMVVGLSEQDWVTLSLDGEIKVMTDPSEIIAVKKVHYTRNPSSQEFESDPNTIFLAFTPSRWKLTDFNTKPITTYDNKT